MTTDLTIKDQLVLPGALISFRFSRAGGPGGQHVNTTDTRARLSFALAECAELRESVKRRLRAAHPGWCTASGELVLSCDQHRSRQRNIEALRERLAEAVREALVVPKRRRPTKPSKGARKRRVDGKTRRGKVKKLRGRVTPE